MYTKEFLVEAFVSRYYGLSVHISIYYFLKELLRNLNLNLLVKFDIILFLSDAKRFSSLVFHAM